jgi:uncharacterized protein
MHEEFNAQGIPEGFYWFNEPASFRLGNGLEICTREKSDFWQRTHYGFQRDNGHCLFTRISGDFTVVTQVECVMQAQYDQCGLMIRADEDNWIKASTERESEHASRLGSVVTNLGWSDWASQDVDIVPEQMWYRISRSKNDFLLEYSFSGSTWLQMRVAHLHSADDQLKVGPYACSPIGKNFRCRFLFFDLDHSSGS